MRKRMAKQLLRNEKGQALVLVLCFLAIGGLTIATLLTYMTTGIKAGQVHERKTNEFYAADAGIELAMWNLMNGESEVPEFPMNSKTVNVTIYDTGNQTYRITSIATSENRSSTTIEAYVIATAGFFDREFDVFDENFQLGEGEQYVGNVWTEQNVKLEVSGNLTGYVYGAENVQLYGGAQITGDVLCGQNVDLGPGAIIIGNVCAEDGIHLDVGAKIIGNVYAQVQVTLADGAIIDGDVHAGEGVSLAGSAIIDGDVYAGESYSLNDSATVTGTIYCPYSYEGCPLTAGSSQVLTWKTK